MKVSKVLLVVVILATLAAMVGCAAPTAAPATTDQAAPAADQAAPAEQGKKTYKDLVVGYAQLGAESEWRTANTASIKETADELGVTLKFSDAQQKQENQIKAIRSFIAQGVDVIGVPPVVETGWETVFKEAQDAGIPIILVDRRADVPEDMYVSYLGSDFVEEGRKAGNEMNKLLPDGGKIVELVGTVGSAPANDRYSGFRETMNPNIEIINSQSGDFTRAKGKEVMEAFLKKYGNEITALYAHNDDMALGAIQAIEEYRPEAGRGHQDRVDRRGARRLPGDDRRQAERHRGMQPAAGTAVLRAGAEGCQRRGSAEVAALRRERVLSRQRRRDAAATPVLRATCF